MLKCSAWRVRQRWAFPNCKRGWLSLIDFSALFFEFHQGGRNIEVTDMTEMLKLL